MRRLLIFRHYVEFVGLCRRVAVPLFSLGFRWCVRGAVGRGFSGFVHGSAVVCIQEVVYGVEYCTLGLGRECWVFHWQLALELPRCFGRGS